VGADSRLAEDARAPGFELGLGRVDFGNLEADMMLPALRVLLEEPRDGGSVAQRLDQLDLAIGRVDEADAHALRRKIERLAMRLGAEHGPIELQALLDRRGCDPDMIQASEFHSTVTFVVTLLAMKQASCALWWRSATVASSGASPLQSIFGRSVTWLIHILPSSRFSRTPSASSM
jgi:hypothetical protein